jgi:hypothetical protein
MARWRETLRHGILFNVTSPDDNFWMEEWGPRPANETDAVEVVTALLERAPALIPIYGHRCIPTEPLLAGNPVFSVVQIDASVLGADLEDYLQRQFGRDARREEELPVGRPIRFWTALACDYKVSVHDYENWNRGLPKGKYRTYYLKEGPGTSSPLRIVRNVDTGEAYWISKFDGDGEIYSAFYRIVGSGNWVH